VAQRKENCCQGNLNEEEQLFHRYEKSSDRCVYRREERSHDILLYQTCQTYILRTFYISSTLLLLLLHQIKVSTAGQKELINIFLPLTFLVPCSCQTNILRTFYISSTLLLLLHQTKVSTAGQKELINNFLPLTFLVPCF
jgi:hypothetical protein